MNKYVCAVLFLFAAVIVQHIARMIYLYNGYANQIYRQYPGKCKHVKGFQTAGSEDLTLLPSGLLLITSGLGFWSSGEAAAIYVMDINKSTDEVHKLDVVGLPSDGQFKPHGIHHWQHENGSFSVFVVSHHPDRVIRFLFDGTSTLTVTKVYQHKTVLHNINSLYVTSEDSFYVTNLFGMDGANPWMCKMELFLQIPMADISHVRGDVYEIAVSSLMLSNGLAGNGRYLYVAVAGGINMYYILPSQELKLHKTIPVSIGSIDNIKLDAAGDLWLGCQPNVAAVVEHLSNQSIACPSQVLRIKDPEGSASVESVWIDDGGFLSCTSVGLFAHNKLFVGTISREMAVCDVHHLNQ